jgi:hypothetical protein
MNSRLKDMIDKLPDEVKHAVIKEYLQKTYYWSVGIFSFLIGTLFGILIN